MQNLSLLHRFVLCIVWVALITSTSAALAMITLPSLDPSMLLVGAVVITIGIIGLRINPEHKPLLASAWMSLSNGFLLATQFGLGIQIPGFSDAVMACVIGVAVLLSISLAFRPHLKEKGVLET